MCLSLLVCPHKMHKKATRSKKAHKISNFKRKQKIDSSSSSEDETAIGEMGKAIDYERMPMVPSKGITSVPKVPDYMLREQALRREQEEEEEPVEAIEEEDRSLDEVVAAMKNLMIRRQAKATITQKENLSAWLYENAISVELTQQNAWRSIFFTSNVSDAVSEHDLQSILDIYMTQKTQ